MEQGELACCLCQSKLLWRGSPATAGPGAAGVVMMPTWVAPGGPGERGRTGTAGGLAGDQAAWRCKAVSPGWQLRWGSGSGPAAYLGSKSPNTT